MKKTILFILIINIFLIQPVIGKTVNIAKVKLIKNGKAYFKLKTGKKYKQLKINQILKNDSIVKSERSTVKLRLLSGTLIELKPGSKILLNKELMKRSSVSLIHGRAKFSIKKLLRTKRDFNVYTPTAVAGVRGTEYEVGIAEDGSTAINVDEGKVVVDNGKEEKTLTKNQGTEASVDSSTISGSKKQINMDKWNEEKNNQIKKDPAGKMEAINNNLFKTLKDQEKQYQELSNIKKGDDAKAGESADSALFNQCKTEGQLNAANNINKKNKDNKEVRESYKKVRTVYTQLNKLNKLIDQKFARLDEIFEKKGTLMDKKLDDAENRFEDKFKGFNKK